MRALPTSARELRPRRPPGGRRPRSTCAHEGVGQRDQQSRRAGPRTTSTGASPPVSSTSVDRAERRGPARVLDAAGRGAGGGSTSPRAAARAPPRRCAARGRGSARRRRSSRRPRASARSGPCAASRTVTVTSRAAPSGAGHEHARAGTGSGRAGRRRARPATSPLRPCGFTTRPMATRSANGAASVHDLHVARDAAPRRHRVEQRAQRVGGAAAPADHAARGRQERPRGRGARRRPRSTPSTRTRSGSSTSARASASSSSFTARLASAAAPRRCAGLRPAS